MALFPERVLIPSDSDHGVKDVVALDSNPGSGLLPKDPPPVFSLAGMPINLFTATEIAQLLFLDEAASYKP